MANDETVLSEVTDFPRPCSWGCPGSKSRNYSYSSSAPPGFNGAEILSWRVYRSGCPLITLLFDMSLAMTLSNTRNVLGLVTDYCVIECS
jgi:hypothetical protein